ASRPEPIADDVTTHPARAHERQLIVLEGCAQAAATPGTNSAARRVLERLGISLVAAPRAGCCGALHYHLGEHAAGRAYMRANIDAWWPLIERGAEAIVMTASGCGATVTEYAQLLGDDANYADKARTVAEMTRDIAEVVDGEDLAALRLTPRRERVALHCPCTLQHAQRLGGTLRSLLSRSGMNLVETQEQHLCCGSAGSYSLLQPLLSERLKERKLTALTVENPDLIVTANVGCQLHLASGTPVPVRHWIEAIAASMGE
ncbi:MAG TPA: glycolate oxidase subunit GlcF, partial [Gammaproteobacteria bacterium]|nr:glycolate oxidase subunit GlcF [Gammaproteobacteria bacterium]